MNATRGWALGAAALSFILVTFAVAVGLGVSSTSPTWRDASAALAILSGIYLILQAIVSFGLGGYIAGRAQSALDPTRTEEVEKDETRQEFCYQLAFTKQTDHVRFSFDPLSPIPCYGGPLGASRDQVILLFPTDGVHGGKVHVNRSRITSPRPPALLVCRKRCDNLRSD
jgi:hypothetical protein